MKINKGIFFILFCFCFIFKTYALSKHFNNDNDSFFYKKLNFRIEKISKHLKLNETQATKIKSILIANHDKIKVIREEEKKSIESVLTAEQNKIWQEKMNKMKNKMKDKFKD